MKIALLGYGKMGKTIAKLIETQYPKHKLVRFKIQTQPTKHGRIRL